MGAVGQGGRPRDLDIDREIVRASRELLSEMGYDAVTMDAAALRAGTSKAAIYRRFRSKAEMLFAAAVHPPTMAAVPDTGSLRGDLLALAERIRADMTTPAAREVAPRVLVEAGRSPEVAQRLRTRFVTGEREQVAQILARAAERGELSDDADAQTVHRVIGGALFFAIFVVGDPIDEPALADLVELISRGVGRR